MSDGSTENDKGRVIPETDSARSASGRTYPRLGTPVLRTFFTYAAIMVTVKDDSYQSLTATSPPAPCPWIFHDPVIRHIRRRFPVRRDHPAIQARERNILPVFSGDLSGNSIFSAILNLRRSETKLLDIHYTRG